MDCVRDVRSRDQICSTQFEQTSSHLGLRAMQTAPAVLNHAMAERDPLLRAATGAIRSCSIFTGSVWLVRPSRRLSRATCVSTTTPDGNAEGRAQHHVGRLAADAGQLDQRVQVLRHLAAVFVDQLPAAGLDVLGLVAEEAGALDGLFQLGQWGARHKSAAVRILPEQVLA